MSHAFSINRPHEFDYDLREDEEQRAIRASKLPLLYAQADPEGWDARRLREREMQEHHAA